MPQQETVHDKQLIIGVIIIILIYEYSVVYHFIKITEKLKLSVYWFQNTLHAIIVSKYLRNSYGVGPINHINFQRVHVVMETEVVNY